MLGVVMMAASVIAIYVRPTAKIADQGPRVNLETLVPERFGGWSIDGSIVPVLPNEQQQAQLNKIYNQTLSRTYADPEGHRIMLSVAYGGDQSYGLQVHRPEVCYTAQGFQVHKEQAAELAVPYGTLPIKRVLAVQGLRSEPITYWILLGDKAIVPGIQWKLTKLSYGFAGKVPDGMLVRISSIDTDEQRAYLLQDSFIKDMLAAMSPADRTRIAGKFGS
jgi:EpsI family protein